MPKLSHGRSRLTAGNRQQYSTYIIWKQMLSRCRNPSAPNFSFYGARGICVCDRWLRFENFLADMGERPEAAQLDRINNSAGYSPNNCRWVSRIVNARNRRSARFIAYKGESHCIAEWCELTGLGQTLRDRLKAGWDIERAFTTPKRKYPA